MTIHIFPDAVAAGGRKALADAVKHLLGDRSDELLQVTGIAAEIAGLSDVDLHHRLSRLFAPGQGHELLCELMASLRMAAADLDAMARCVASVRERLVGSLTHNGVVS